MATKQQSLPPIDQLVLNLLNEAEAYFRDSRPGRYGVWRIGSLPPSAAAAYGMVKAVRWIITHPNEAGGTVTKGTYRRAWARTQSILDRTGE